MPLTEHDPQPRPVAPSQAATGSPFDLAQDAAYRRWRAAKLAARPAQAEQMIVDVADPRALSDTERAALRERCSRANMALYRSPVRDADPGLPLAIGRQLGLARLDAHWLAEEDGVASIAVAQRDTAERPRAGFIPYTDRAIKWHTDGYYQPPERNIRGMLLHCVRPAAAGGANALLDHELAYIALRDASPDHIRALMADDAMTIPARTDDDGVARDTQTGPVFSVDATGALHMRYTARTRSIAWKDDAATRAAVAALERPARRRLARCAAPAHGGRHGPDLPQRAARPRGLHRRPGAAAAAVPGPLSRPHRLPGAGMAQWVTVWRAAQLVGVARGALQQQVRSGALPLADGMVSTDALLKLYPDTRLEDSGMLERVDAIRNDAFARRVRERTLPSQEVLAQRLFQQSAELADVRHHLARYHVLLVALREALGEHAEDPTCARLAQQLDRGLAEALATEPVDVLDAMDDMLKVMSAQVTLRPSGHEFSVHGHDTLLQAGLKSGLKLNYGCGNGSCGMCKVRVISGEVCKVQHFDYPLSEAERQQGYTLMCAHTAASSELTLESLEARGPQDIPPQDLVAQVRGVTPLASDTRLLHLQTPRSHRLRFLAGQSVTLGRATPAGDMQATLPVASCPCDDRNLHFHIARDDADAFSRWVFSDACRSGEPVAVRGPMGDFVLGDSARSLVFAGCDTGFAPLKSLIEHALALEAAPGMSLYWLATRPDGHFLANQCRAWSEALDAFEYAPSQHADPAEGARQMATAMRADLFDIDCEFYVAGPEAFVNTLAPLLTAAGVPAAQRHLLVL